MKKVVVSRFWVDVVESWGMDARQRHMPPEGCPVAEGLVVSGLCCSFSRLFWYPGTWYVVCTGGQNLLLIWFFGPRLMQGVSSC